MPKSDKSYQYIFLLSISFLFLIMSMMYFCIKKHHQKHIIGCGKECKGNCKMSENARRFGEMDLILIKMDGCIHCSRLMDLLERNNLINLLKVIDSNSNDVDVLRQKYGAIDGFPTMISVVTGKKLVGGRQKIEDIIEELS